MSQEVSRRCCKCLGPPCQRRPSHRRDSANSASSDLFKGE